MVFHENSNYLCHICFKSNKYLCFVSTTAPICLLRLKTYFNVSKHFDGKLIVHFSEINRIHANIVERKQFEFYEQLYWMVVYAWPLINFCKYSSKCASFTTFIQYTKKCWHICDFQIRNRWRSGNFRSIVKIMLFTFVHQKGKRKNSVFSYRRFKNMNFIQGSIPTWKLLLFGATNWPVCKMHKIFNQIQWNFNPLTKFKVTANKLKSKCLEDQCDGDLIPVDGDTNEHTHKESDTDTYTPANDDAKKRTTEKCAFHTDSEGKKTPSHNRVECNQWGIERGHQP